MTISIIKFFMIIKSFPYLFFKNLFVSFIVLSLCFATNAQTKSRPLLGDYAFALYYTQEGYLTIYPDNDSHVATDSLIKRLVQLNANTYMWLIGPSKNDWNDLKDFLPKAKMAGISVWVYLAPPSEIPPIREPYREDYISWAKAIARLSLRYSNLIGYVIDDFWYNVQVSNFTPSYIEDMINAGKTINQKLKFYPLTYSGEIFNPYIQNMSELFDGLIDAFPRDSLQIAKNISLINSSLHSKVIIRFPPETSSNTGQNGIISQRAKIINDIDTTITFRVWAGYVSYNFNEPTPGYHKFVLQIDSNSVWSADYSDIRDSIVTLNLGPFLHDKSYATISLGVLESRGVGNYKLNVAYLDLSARGLQINTDLGSNSWSINKTGAFSIQKIGANIGKKLPIILMPAADIYTYPKFYPDSVTVKNRTDKIKMMLGFLSQGQVDGLVSYCIDKTSGSVIFDSAKKVYLNFWINLK